MKKQITFFMIIFMLFSVKIYSQLSITGPDSISLTQSQNYTATTLPGYTYTWGISNTNVTLSSIGSIAVLTANSIGNVILSVVAFKDKNSPSYCASISVNVVNPIQPVDQCSTMYKIKAIQCSPNQFTTNGWKFQLVNKSTGVSVNPPNAFWNSLLVQSTGLAYFIIDSSSSGYMLGHPNPDYFIDDDPNDGIYSPSNLQFSVICTVNGCSFIYRQYFGDTCNDPITGVPNGQTGYLSSNGTWIFD